MRAMRRTAFTAFLLPAVMGLPACGDGPVEQTLVTHPHSLTVSIASAGIGFDETGYLLSVDDRPVTRVYTQDEKKIDGLSEPVHTVTLSDVAETCVVLGANPRTVQVQPRAASAAIRFDVTCSIALEGTIAFMEIQDEEPHHRVAVWQLETPTHTLLAAGVDPAWSPEGTRIAFTRVTDCGIWDICEPVGISVVTYPGGVQADLTSDGGENPSWSPDGRTILFKRWDTIAGYSIYRMNADGTGISKLVPSPGIVTAWDAAWSPDGSRIVFACDSDICIANADGTGATRLSSDPEFEEQPVWSPDGTRIAFRTWDFFSGNQAWIAVVNVDGTGRRRLHPGTDPSWAADGERLVFTAYWQISAPAWMEGLAIIRADGSDLVILTETWYTMYPAWRPEL